jgi:hypothetical protein
MSSESPNLELRRVVHELERHASQSGWDQPARIFALVETSDLLTREPDLAEALGVEGDATGFTPVEQEALAPERELEEVLMEIVWPDIVPGCAVVVERLVLPPEAEADVPEDPAAAAEFATNHPDRQEVRIVVGVLREGGTWCALRMRTHDDDLEVLAGEDLVPGLASLLLDTLLPDLPEGMISE